GVVTGRARCRTYVWPMALLALGSAVVWAALGGRSLERAALALAATVGSGDLAGARALLPTLAGRDPAALGATELCRAGIESVAENTADAVTGPLLWGAVAGPAGVAVYRAANTLDAMVGHRNERYEHFGWAAARLDDVLTWPAARLACAVTGLRRRASLRQEHGREQRAGVGPASTVPRERSPAVKRARR